MRYVTGGRRLLRGAVLAAAAIAPATAQAGPLVDTCKQVNRLLHGPCRVVEQATGHVESTLVRQQRAAQVAAFETSWNARALDFQFHLADDVDLVDAPWVGTHNSFNSWAQSGITLSASDSNQQITLVDQLRLGVRSVELDLHWWPALGRLGARAPVVCHALGGHEGCTTEPTFDRTLAGVSAWLKANPDEVFLLYLEPHLDGAEGERSAVATLEAQLGERIYRPVGGGCRSLPLDVSRADVAAAGKQVVVMTNGCGASGEWLGITFNGRNRVEDRPIGFAEFPACGPTISRAQYASTIVRYYEDSTALTPTAATADDGITPLTAARMMRCGVDLLGLDQLLPTDPRLPALVWSWAPDEPRPSGDCVVQRASRWYATGCETVLPAACRSADGSWHVTAPTTVALARHLCEEHETLATPRTGYENELLRAAAGGGDVLLGLERQGSSFVSHDGR